MAQHVNHRASDEIAELNAAIERKDAALRMAQKYIEQGDGDYDAVVAAIDAALEG